LHTSKTILKIKTTVE